MAIWSPIERAAGWVSDRVATGAAAFNAGYDAGNMPGDFNPATFVPSVPSPAAAGAAGGPAVPQRAFIAAEIRVKAEPGTAASVETEKAGIDQLDVGRSMAY